MKNRIDSCQYLKGNDLLKMIRRFIRLLFLSLGLIFIGVGFTTAYVTDRASVVNNTYFTGNIELPKPQPGEIIINEVMWMGSKDLGVPAYDGPKDQWIELKNVSNRDFHRKGLYLTYLDDSGVERALYTVKDNRVIKAGEFMLLTHYIKNNSAINVNPDETGINNFDINRFQIRLYADSSKSVLIDTAGDGTGLPQKGDAVNFYSMQRNAIPGDGSSYTNWHTCVNPLTTGLYWKSGRIERGTPGGENV